MIVRSMSPYLAAAAAVPAALCHRVLVVAQQHILQLQIRVDELHPVTNCNDNTNEGADNYLRSVMRCCTLQYKRASGCDIGKLLLCRPSQSHHDSTTTVVPVIVLLL